MDIVTILPGQMNGIEPGSYLDLSKVDQGRRGVAERILQTHYPSVRLTDFGNYAHIGPFPDAGQTGTMRELLLHRAVL